MLKGAPVHGPASANAGSDRRRYRTWVTVAIVASLASVGGLVYARYGQGTPLVPGLTVTAGGLVGRALALRHARRYAPGRSPAGAAPGFRWQTAALIGALVALVATFVAAALTG